MHISNYEPHVNDIFVEETLKGKVWVSNRYFLDSFHKRGLPIPDHRIFGDSVGVAGLGTYKKVYNGETYYSLVNMPISSKNSVSISWEEYLKLIRNKR